jgi:hypothetical protein
MIISIGFVRSASQILIKEFNWQQNSLDSRLIDVTDLADFNLQALFIDDNEHFSSLAPLLEKEKAYYPILEARDENLNFISFEALAPQAFKDLYLKILNRWTMHQNLNSLESIWNLTHHFRDLWKKDRISFFEEFWYWMKRNLGAVDMTIIFNDIVNSEEKDDNEEKKDRPKLVQSLISGSKKGNFQQGTPKEKELMQNYLEKFHDIFEITEFHPLKGQFVATAQIERSPLIFMAHTPQLNQLQRSLLAGVFKAMQF